jgi:biopolymer transport protein ExbB
VATLIYALEHCRGSLWPLGVCSVVWLALTLERVACLFARRVRLEALLDALGGALARGDVSEAIAISARARGPAGRLAMAALREALQRPARVEAALAEQLARERPLLHGRIPMIGSLAGIGTLLGLYGTITGLIVPFGYGPSDAVSRACALALGISQSLCCTAGGLLVAIVAMTSAELLRLRAEALDAELSLAERALANLVQRHRQRLRWNGERAVIDEPGTYRDEHVHQRAA